MEDQMTPLQQNVLQRYGKLATSLHSLDESIRKLKQQQQASDSDVTPEDVLSEIREVEVKLGLIWTLLKGSVYSYVLQKQAK